jgi:hypothetical protein
MVINSIQDPEPDLVLFGSEPFVQLDFFVLDLRAISTIS